MLGICRIFTLLLFGVNVHVDQVIEVIRVSFGLKPTMGSSGKRGTSAGVKFYLILYNFVQTVGWSYLLYQLINFYLHPTPSSLYETVKWSVIIFQNAAILEVMHAATGMVPSNPIITAQQIASRVLVVCGVLMITEAPRNGLGLPLALLAWSVTEVIRYANYTLNLINMIPYFLKYLRYTTFIILYPLGVTGELLCIYAASKEVAERKLLTYQMPNSLNFIFNYQYFLLFVMLLYVPLFPQMYMHMFTQRRKVLGTPAKKEN